MSLRLDAQGKTYAQALMRLKLELPEALAAEVRSHWRERPAEFAASAPPPTQSGAGSHP
jgi:hypothetical protein